MLGIEQPVTNEEEISGLGKAIALKYSDCPPHSIIVERFCGLNLYFLNLDQWLILISRGQIITAGVSGAIKPPFQKYC